jgi:hypothetical protein
MSARLDVIKFEKSVMVALFVMLSNQLWLAGPTLPVYSCQSDMYSKEE